MTGTCQGFPPPPWHSTGTLWCGLLRAAAPVRLPGGLTHLLPARTIAFLLVRYREGTLRYDEFMIGSLARRGHRAALWVHAIWVDDPQSRQGGREIWGLPKELADFAWHVGGVRISDASGTIAALRVDGPPPRGPRLPLIATGFGELDGHLSYFCGRLRGSVGRARIEVTEWGARLPALRNPDARLALQVSPFRMTVGGPVFLTGELTAGDGVPMPL